ncbi:ABC transporter ATP-binding protein/permease [Vibrio europaeus]|uniref:ATP-binding cassette domain-containing protein n=1 Tax=Vibrio europaeus TaxID=300876 RepID=UPI00234205CD|nr:ABC transporter ATP-binding protein [Vibrio europaeus]MDC5850458.1 ABC transporter ATP-binding protein/permease [Vibrio europaeus]
MTEIEFAKKIILKEYPGKITVLVVNEMLGAALVLLSLGTVVPFLGSLLGGNKHLPGPLGELFAFLGIENWSSLEILAMLVALMLIRTVLEGFRQYLTGEIGLKLNQTIKLSMNRSISQSNWTTFKGIDQGKYMQCLVAESSLARGAVSDLASALSFAILTAVLLVWMAVYSPSIFIVFSCIGLLFLWTNKGLILALKNSSQKRISLMSYMNTKVTDLKYSFKVLCAENLLGKMSERLEKLIDSIVIVERKQLILAVIVDNYVVLFGTFAIASMFVADYVTGGGDDGVLLFNIMLVQRISTYLANFQSKRKSMVQKIPSYEACLEMMELNVTPTLFSDACGSYELKKFIEVKGLNYKHKDAELPTLKDINITLPSRGIRFFVGASGSGKTTLVDVIVGLNELDNADALLIDGKRLNTIGRHNWANSIAYVPQDAYLLAGTLRDYLTFGNQSSSEEEIWEALENVGIAQKVRSLPGGLETLVDSKGTSFSGGERQRLSIARALVRNVKAIFLDEPSSGLDKDTEQVLFNSLIALSKDLLVVVVTHSQEVIKNMDDIYLFEQGEVVWNGSYSDFPKSINI